MEVPIISIETSPALLQLLGPVWLEDGPWPCWSDPDLWFAEHSDRVETAKQLCRECPVRQACLEGALARREPWGVWGGEVFERGRVQPTKRGRGRPRKYAVA
ncbi:WhiB family transcriptional regulator [Ruania zhangjianzhongii]|uniref:WhiB family transcriptional regulator n=1 Tax=Ruania zhangjianzhongii TaxID=2603206 RepID=UPI0011C8726C|nr:WhiB family transcriptional regulator [Ruania zhangjianzhongii]